MTDPNEITYSKILVIKPDTTSYQTDGTTVAIIDENTFVIENFIVLSAKCISHLVEQTHNSWNQHVGSNVEPKVLCIEYSQHCFARTTIMKGIICACVENKFFPSFRIRYHSGEWRQSKRNLPRLIEKKQGYLNPEIFEKISRAVLVDTVALAFWAFEESKKLNFFR